MDKRFIFYFLKTLRVWRSLLPRKIKRFFPGRLITLALFLLFVWFAVLKIDLSALFPTSSPQQEQTEARFYSNQSNKNLKSTYLQAIRSANKSILILIYSLRDRSIIEALNQQAYNGVDVTIICDSEASREIDLQLQPNIKVFYQSGIGIMHLKLLVIDSDGVYMGSANLTGKSLSSHGNLVIGLNSPTMAKAIEQLAESMINPAQKSPKSTVIQLPHQKIELWFLPAAGKLAYHRLMNLLYQAKSSLHIAMYTLTHPQLVEAIIDANDRGVALELVLDRGQAMEQGNKAYRKLIDAGVRVGLSDSEDLLHYKMAWIDERILVNGSANWTVSAFNRNDDCFLVIEPLGAKQNDELTKLWKAIFSNATYEPVNAFHLIR